MIGTIIVALILLFAVSIVIWYLIKAKRSGKKISCGGICDNCAQNVGCTKQNYHNFFKIQLFEMKNIPLVVDVVEPLWCPPIGDRAFKRFNVEYIIRNNLFENDFHYQLVEYDDSTGSEQFCAIAFFARKGDVCKAEEWFSQESKKYPQELLKASGMSKAYIELMDKKTFEMMNEDDIKLSLYVSHKKGCGSKLLNELCIRFKNLGYKNLYLWTDCECNWEWYTNHGYELVNQDIYPPLSNDKDDYSTYIFRKKL